jgi:uncharacterized protein YndB with AHSA1/START domain
MTNIEHTPATAGSSEGYRKTIHVAAPADAVFDALTTLDGLTAWWTRATGSAQTGGQISFWFDPPEPCVMKVEEATRPSSVRWTVTACDFLPDWVGTRPTFTIDPVDAETCELEFRHVGLTSELDCIEMCTRGWDHFIPSLRDHAERGEGSPHGSAADRARRR